jgi:2-(1,2-epoxy-1,2-dihydrophenyl)acetyl-CoA isomerase
MNQTPVNSPVQCELGDGTATVIMDRPDALNALDVGMKTALLDALVRVADDASIRAVVLTGRGRAFSVGQDLREHARNLDTLPLESVWATVAEHFAPISLTLATMPKPVIAAVNGIAAGAGASIAFACDFRIVAHSAAFNLAFTGIGLSADTGATWTLPRLVGRAKALELLIMPSTVAADEALALGLATSVVPAADLASAAARLAHRLAAGPTVAYAAVKEAVTFSSTHGLAEALANEGTLMARTGGTNDHRSAVASFLAKETPVFTGH